MNLFPDVNVAKKGTDSAHDILCQSPKQYVSDISQPCYSQNVIKFYLTLILKCIQITTVPVSQSNTDGVADTQTCSASCAVS